MAEDGDSNPGLAKMANGLRNCPLSTSPAPARDRGFESVLVQRRVRRTSNLISLGIFSARRAHLGSGIVRFRRVLARPNGRPRSSLRLVGLGPALGNYGRDRPEAYPSRAGSDSSGPCDREQPRVLPAAVWLLRLSETAERLRDLAAESGIGARACITISHQGQRWLPLLPGVTEAISLP